MDPDQHESALGENSWIRIQEVKSHQKGAKKCWLTKKKSVNLVLHLDLFHQIKYSKSKKQVYI